MPEGLITQAIKTFLTQYIHSVDELNVLMLVRTAPAKNWSATDVSDMLRIDPISASNRLVALYLQGFLTHPKEVGPLYHYRYHPPRMVEKITAELAQVYETYHAEICDYVEQNQRGQMKAFASAFDFKKDR